MKRTLLPLVFAAAMPLMMMSSASKASDLPTAAPQSIVPTGALLTLQNPVTKQMQSLSFTDISDPVKMRDFVAPLPYAPELYEAYVKVGYAPLHALILANWDASEAIRAIAPKIPGNPLMEDKINNILKLYQPVQ